MKTVLVILAGGVVGVALIAATKKFIPDVGKYL